MAHAVFISYSSRQQDLADLVLAALEQHQIPCWMAPRDIAPGADWAAAIVDAIAQSRLVLLLFSEASNVSEQVKREMENAVRQRVPILPVRVENVPLAKHMHYFIGSCHWLDATAQSELPLPAIVRVVHRLTCGRSLIGSAPAAGQSLGSPGHEPEPSRPGASAGEGLPGGAPLFSGTGENPQPDGRQREWLAGQSARLIGSDPQTLLEELAAFLQSVHPTVTEVEHRRGLLARRVPCRIQVRLGEDCYLLEDLGRGTLRTRQTRVVRGIVLKTRDLPLADWLAALGAALDACASADAHVRERLARFLG